MQKSRRITIELIECDPKEMEYMGPYNKTRYDADGKSTRIEYSGDVGTDATGGGETKYEYKQGHITGEEAAKIVKKLINETSTKGKVIFKSLSALFKSISI